MNKIEILGKRSHSKASERYVDVIFKYGNHRLHLSVPIEDRRAGINIHDDQKINEYLKKVYEAMNPKTWDKWRQEQEDFWETRPRAKTTKPFFDVLTQDVKWNCVACSLPKNSNPARRIQAIKDLGYTLSTDTNRGCPVCKKKSTHYMLLPIQRGEETAYEILSLKLKRKIIATLNSYDAFEGKPISHLLPDHKFPEIRWDSKTKRDNIEDLSSNEIQRDFQLLSNQRNEQKREVCRNCYQTGERGTICGIEYYSKGGKTWDKNIPKRGKSAEKGCVGCPWYDIEAWRRSLLAVIKQI